MTIELDPQGTRLRSQLFGLLSTPEEYSAMRYIVLNLTSLTHQSAYDSIEYHGGPNDYQNNSVKQMNVQSH